MIITATTLAIAFDDLANMLDGYRPAPQPGDDLTVQRLTNPAGRTISARARTEGTTLQLWITAPRTPAAAPSPDRPRPLRPGRNYHTVLNLLDLDGDPAQTIHSVLTRDLLPVFDAKPYYVGHRPWDAAATAARRPNWQTTRDTDDEPDQNDTDTLTDPGADAAEADAAQPTQAAASEPTGSAETNADPAQPSVAEITQPARTPEPTPAPAAKKTTPARKAAPAKKATPTKTASAKKPPAAKKATAAKKAAPAKKATAAKPDPAPAKKAPAVKKPGPARPSTPAAKTDTPTAGTRPRKSTAKTTSPS
ncbi:hypothetical protein [Kitasatospora purpeofusca]|uniref:hypothetical protein n=1 Tax=Kitasatospora purpeofusca TaxID=67352 RepID=UPI002A5A56BB|nr:hypothetical protein [Kitasatospora purpeofusca]MDY0811403.1 hypothetical protein [Kitasatospora purpeofusca]